MGGSQARSNQSLNNHRFSLSQHITTVHIQNVSGCQNKIAPTSTDPLPTNMIEHQAASRTSHLNKVKVQIVKNNALNGDQRVAVEETVAQSVMVQWASPLASAPLQIGQS